MTVRADYNIVDLPIDKGLSNHAISAGKNYIILFDAPPLAEVTIRLNDNTADEIPLKENFAINAKGIKNIYVSCNAIPGGKIKLGTSSTAENFNIITAPVVKDIESIAKLEEVNSFSSALLAELDKITNPYEEPTTMQGECNLLTTTTVVHSETLNCDKIDINLAITRKDCIHSYGDQCGIACLIDDIVVARILCYGNAGLIVNVPQTTLKNIRGKTLKIIHGASSTNDTSQYTLQKYNKKG